MNIIRILSALLALGVTTTAQAASVDLAGRVSNPQNAPVTNALIFIDSAQPKEGTSSLCPYCYADCTKEGRTTAEGRFTIKEVSLTLRFQLLIVAEGYESKFVDNVDPVQGEKNVTLEPLSEAAMNSTNRVAGLVIGEDGKPIARAIIVPEGVDQGSSGHWGGSSRFVDPLVVSNEKGHFILRCKEPVDTIYAKVQARGLAQRWVDLTPGRDQLIRMQEGATVTGRVLCDGKPVKDALVGASSTNHRAGNGFVCDPIGTDKDGGFVLANLPPEHAFVLYVKTDSLHGQGVVIPKHLTTMKTKTTQNIGVLAVERGYRLAGRVVLSDGKSIPSNINMFLSRQEAWDHSEALIDGEGRFEFNNVPAESLGLTVRIGGYKFSKRNPSLDWCNGGIVGRLTNDITNLTIIMEPGEWRYEDYRKDVDSGEVKDPQPREKPLRGARP